MQLCYTNSLQLPSLLQSSKSHSERDLDSTVVGWWQECFSQRGIAAQQAMCGLVRYRDAETTLPSTCRTVFSKLHRTSIPVITQQPYSPDLAPSDFWLLPTLKMCLKGTRFATMEDIRSNATAELRKIPKEAFCRCFQQWQDRRSKYVRARVLLWRWLGKCCRMSYHYSATPHFRELFDCPSYIRILNM
jgi:hypothetical protein